MFAANVSQESLGRRIDPADNPRRVEDIARDTDVLQRLLDVAADHEAPCRLPHVGSVADRAGRKRRPDADQRPGDGLTGLAKDGLSRVSDTQRRGHYLSGAGIREAFRRLQCRLGMLRRQLDFVWMGTFLQRRHRVPPAIPDAAKHRTTHDARAGQWGEVQFVPARWLVLLLSVVWAVFSPGPISKVGITSLVWSFAPRSVKIAAGGLAAAAMVVLLGAIAAIALLALQLT